MNNNQMQTKTNVDKFTQKPRWLVSHHLRYDALLNVTGSPPVPSKLRKREDHGVSQTDVETAPQVLPTTETTVNHNNNSTQQATPIAYRQNPSSVWVFPPLPPQPNLYLHNASSQIALMQNDKGGYRGFKKQLSGRFKRLVNRKPQEPSPCIPPELKPQLKTIYVY